MVRVSICFIVAAAVASAQWVTFDNTSSPVIMTMTTPLFSIAFSKANGAILIISDKLNRSLSQGNRGQCFWGLSGAGGEYVGGCNFNAMPYTFDPVIGRLTINYSPPVGPPGSPTVQVTVTAPVNQPFFDLSFALLAPPSNNASYTTLLFPAELMFNTTDIDGVHLPMLPGVKVGSGYFSQANPAPWQGTYPGGGSFASWQLVSTANGSFSLYDLSGPDTILPHYYGLFPASSSGRPLPPSLWFLLQSMPVNVTAGCNASASTIVVDGNGKPIYPCALGVGGTVTRRIVIGDADPLVAMQRYAYDNGIGSGDSMVRWQGMFGPAAGAAAAFHGPDAASAPYPTLVDKIGAGLAAQASQAPLLKADAVVMGYLPFRDYTPVITSLLPVPSLLHIMAFEINGFDSNYPDYCPPDPRMNSTCCDLGDALYQANQMGHVTVVYANPTWWDTRSATLANQTGGLLDNWAVLNASYLPRYETYDPVPHTGIAVCMRAPNAYARTVELVRQFSLNYTGVGDAHALSASSYACNASDVRLPMTFVFEDQLGARFPTVDYSPFNTGMGALGYEQAIQTHLANFSSAAIHTEQGVDRLARHAVGFHGAVLGAQLGGQTQAWFGDANWIPEPLFGTILRDVALHYQHNLDGTAMAGNMSLLCWSLSLGVHLSMDLHGHPFNATWVNTVAAFQRIAAARFASAPVVAFDRNATAQVTQFAAAGSNATGDANTSSTAVYTAFSNPSATSPATLQVGYPDEGLAMPVTVPAQGCTVTSTASDVVAGFFTAYNGAALAPGTVHALIEDRACTWLQPVPGTPSVCVWHPYGVDTQVTIVVPAALRSQQLGVHAVNAAGSVLEAVAFNATANGALVSFLWQAQLPSGQASAYVLSSASAGA